MKSTNAKIPPNTDKLLAYLFLDRLSGEHACGWAVGALEAGFDTDALAILAGMSLERELSFYEAEPFLTKALQELHIFEPVNRESVLRNYAMSVVAALVYGKMSARTALDEIHSFVVEPLGHPADLMGWCYLWEGNSADGSFAEVSEQEIEQEAKAFALRWLASVE